MNEMINILPAITLRGAVVLPDMVTHFDINRERTIRAIEQAMSHDQKIFLIAQRSTSEPKADREHLYRVGTIARIKQVIKMPKQVIRILVEGIDRAELLALNDTGDYAKARVVGFEQTTTVLDPIMTEAMLRNLKEIFIHYCNENPKINSEMASQILDISDVEKLVDQIGINLPIPYEKRQQLLEAISLTSRYDLLTTMMQNEIEVMVIRNALQERVKERIDKNQKEYILREQLKLIREELGEDTTFVDGDRFQEELEQLAAPEEIREKVAGEIKRFKNSANPSETAVIRGYIETLLSMPWEKESKDNPDIAAARAILEKDHYGLDKVKERILEYLAVRTMAKQGDRPILCLIGPPGTGKTSIARSIARALDKKYVRISLGGVRDEAEIRGHRRTYIGAMPGRVVSGLKQAGVKNPLMLLDEIDKVSSDYKGDTSSALLEVLDSEQNSNFVDHYVEVPMDLSQVFFIATANDPQTIPRPLLDRMELIEITSYTENEKLHIAEDHLLPKQREAHGLKKSQLRIRRDALAGIISGYTKEAGVRSLERKIGDVCRKTARKILEEEQKSVTVSEKNLADYLGKSRYHIQEKNEVDEIGIVRGLAWTSVGGDTLQIEVNILPGKGEFMLTGQLGDVMKESAQTGISYIRSIAGEYEIDEEMFTKHDIHIHIPEGAVPKDGPSAGITMATAMLSALTGKSVRADVAMTGEITLRGRVLPIGGLKEKLLAAKNAGIKTVIVPVKNRVDVEEITQEIIGGLEMIYAAGMDEVLPVALGSMS